MTEIIEDKQSANVGNRQVHMANERTFLAWIRTSIGIMAFGFVVEKFTLFMKQMSVILGKSSIENTVPPSQSERIIDAMRKYLAKHHPIRAELRGAYIVV